MHLAVLILNVLFVRCFPFDDNSKREKDALNACGSCGGMLGILISARLGNVVYKIWREHQTKGQIDRGSRLGLEFGKVVKAAERRFWIAKTLGGILRSDHTHFQQVSLCE